MKPKEPTQHWIVLQILYVSYMYSSNVSINIMPSNRSIASNISFNHQCLELEETTNYVEVGCLKNELHGNLPVIGM